MSEAACLQGDEGYGACARAANGGDKVLLECADEGKALDNPSVSFADSSLCTREPLGCGIPAGA